MSLPDFSAPAPSRRLRSAPAPARAPDRGTGRTKAMLRELPDGPSVVIVHTPHLKPYVRNLARHLNSIDGRSRDPQVYAVEDGADLISLRGMSQPVVVDHAFWSEGRPLARETVASFLSTRHAAVARLVLPTSGPTVIEAADTMGIAPSIVAADTLALTVRWPDGDETIEYVTERAAALLGYRREDMR